MIFCRLPLLWACVLCAASEQLSDDCPSSAGGPPERPPAQILDQLTLGGIIPIQYYYVDDSNKGKGTHYKYSYEDISEMIVQAKTFVSRVLDTPPPPPPLTHPHTSTWLTQLTDIWLVHALHRYRVAGLSVCVYGSTSPWYESLLLAMGAASVTTIEYNRLSYDHPDITTLMVGERHGSSVREGHGSSVGGGRGLCDRALSLSSFDHDGLGRYGDPINPIGDLVAMETVKQDLRSDGLLFLTVPIGLDVVVWNLHRRYGNHRLPLLLSDWTEIECVGWSAELAQSNVTYTAVYEPVFILSPNTGHNDSLL